MRREKWWQAAYLATALIIMAIPWGVNDYRVETADGGVAHEVVSRYSFFETAPFLNGNIGPFLTMVFTVLSLVMMLLVLLADNPKPLYIGCVAVSSLALVASLLPVLQYGIKALTVPGVTITLLLTYSLIISIQYVIGRGFKKYDDDDDDD